MKSIIAERISFDEIKLPKRVYKYRQASNVIHRTILTNQEVFFAPPNSFEDKIDCKIPIRYDLLTNDEIYTAYYELLKANNPKWPEDYLRYQTQIWYDMGLIRDPKRSEALEEHYWNMLNKQYGVLSLTANPTNLKMWEKYSDNLNGFCVGFDPKIMFKYLGGGGQVNYYDVLPIIKPFDQIDAKIVLNTYSKLKKWSFEEEYRTQMFWPDEIDNAARTIKLPNSAYVEIIIGSEVDTKTKSELIFQARAINPNIEINIASTDLLNIELKSFA